MTKDKLINQREDLETKCHRCNGAGMIQNPAWEEFIDSGAEAREICAWEGWHPHYRWQLEMFFGLKDEHIMEEGE